MPMSAASEDCLRANASTQGFCTMIIAIVEVPHGVVLPLLHR